ncbi:MAG: dUTP diphosphatase, partial [Sinobacterium sp.]
DNGYKEGTYIKNWAGREDNEHLVELAAELEKSAGDFSEQLYKALDSRYKQLQS